MGSRVRLVGTDSADALKYTELEKPGVNELHVAEHGDADSEDTRGCDGLKGD